MSGWYNWNDEQIYKDNSLNALSTYTVPGTFLGTVATEQTKISARMGHTSTF